MYMYVYGYVRFRRTEIKLIAKLNKITKRVYMFIFS